MQQAFIGKSFLYLWKGGHTVIKNQMCRGCLWRACGPWASEGNVANVSELRRSEMSSIIPVLSDLCLIDSFFFLLISAFNLLRNQVCCWTITNNLYYTLFPYIVLITILGSVYVKQTCALSHGFYQIKSTFYHSNYALLLYCYENTQR